MIAQIMQTLLPGCSSLLWRSRLFSLVSSFNKNSLRSNIKRRYSREQANDPSYGDLLNQKLAECKTRNILIYSCKSDGALRVNVIGIIGGFLLIGASYNTWYIFDSVKFKNRRIDDETGFFRKALNIIGTDKFKIALCGCTFLIGFRLFFQF
jgi:hypothetical protein